MKVEFTHDFIKTYKKRFANKSNIRKKFEERTKRFSANPQDLTLKDHTLSGKLEGFRSFSVTGDIRVIYYVYKNTAYFVDIGSHNQVYGK
ncbi:MAG: type II toxin-antitoxin system mRNA interferase toxin, RelE/StbE family [Patescibacteria group bacterium]|nr:type II toxin-antitoxin system mRNA interferase toxin, RelE/StbE family [Patescibacteria group bacterium]